MTIALKSNFLANARGFTFKDSASVTWSFNGNLNELTATAVGGSGLTSVGLSDSSGTPIYAVGNSPLVANGTLTLTLNTQVQKTFLAGPTSGANAQPTFRVLAVADVPVLAYVTSVGLSDASATPIYSISGSPVTAAGTLAFTLATQTANRVFAGPTSGGVAQPTFRALVAADVPSSILPGSFSGFANPSGLIGLIAVNGVATTADRSDSTHAIDQGITPTWTAQHTFSASVVVGAPVGGSKGTGTLNTTGLFINGAPVSPSANNAPVVMVTGQFLYQYQQIRLQSTDQMALVGTARAIVSRAGPDFLPGPQGEAFEGTGQVTLGMPKTPVISFAVPTEYVYNLIKRLILPSAVRANLIGTANLVVFDETSTGPQGEAYAGTAQTVLGRPQNPTVNFSVLSDYVCDFFGRLILGGALRANLINTAKMVVFDDFGTRSRITLAGANARG